MRTTKLRLALVLLLSVWTNVLTASSTNVEQAEEDARKTARRVRRKKTGPVVLVVDDAHFIKRYSESCRIIECELISEKLYFGIFVRYRRIPIVVVYRPR